MSRHYEWDDYFLPDHPGVLKNLLGATDPLELTLHEYAKTIERVHELHTGAVQIPQTFDEDHIKALHRHIFQDIYEWAGEYRTVNMSKTRPERHWPNPGEPAYELFVHHSVIPACVQEITAPISMVDWSALTAEQVSIELAVLHSQINLAHPFREGNGRVMREFLADVAEHAGYEFRGPLPAGDKYIDAVIAANESDIGPLSELIRRRLRPTEPPVDTAALAARAQDLTKAPRALEDSVRYGTYGPQAGTPYGPRL